MVTHMKGYSEDDLHGMQDPKVALKAASTLHNGKYVLERDVTADALSADILTSTV
jgi:hypothetical protein